MIDLDRHQWALRAECRREDPELFFAADGERGGSRDNQDRVEAAKAICRTCTVLAECLDYAVTTRQHEGIWGGLTEDERRPLLTRKARP